MQEQRLSPRKEVILRSLVEHYIRTAEPVASKLISDQLLRIPVQAMPRRRCVTSWPRWKRPG